jgi:predicted SprT family Zn-dependent metalloprotease
MQAPTLQAYKELQEAYDYFNQELFSGKLPNCLITMQRRKHALGYFAKKRFENTSGDTTDEIAMNPQYFKRLGINELLSTLVHEMAHLWQFHFGSPGRGRYHNREWAQKMEDIGLMPSSTGMPGGKKTGDCMSDYMIEGGRFEKSLKNLLGKGFMVSWSDRCVRLLIKNEDGVGNNTNSEGKIQTIQIVSLNNSNRNKYSCAECGINAWGKPGLNIACGDCRIQLIEQVQTSRKKKRIIWK